MPNLRAQFGRLYRYQAALYEHLQPLRRRALPSRPTSEVATERHGSGEAGYDVAAGSLSEHSIVLSFGVGIETSFEESLSATYGCRIEAFDPTEQAARHVATREWPSTFRYHQIGIAGVDGDAEFADIIYPTDAYAAVTAADLGGHHVATQSFPVRRLPTLLDELRIDHVDVLKLDVEGSEYAAWDDLVALSHRVDQVIVEFHPWIVNWGKRIPLMFGRRGWRTTREAINRLLTSGFEIAAVSDRGTEFLFVRPAGRSGRALPSAG